MVPAQLNAHTSMRGRLSFNCMNQLLLLAVSSSDRYSALRVVKHTNGWSGHASKAKKIELGCIRARPAPTCPSIGKNSQRCQGSDLLAGAARLCSIHRPLVEGPVFPPVCLPTGSAAAVSHSENCVAMARECEKQNTGVHNKSATHTQFGVRTPRPLDYRYLKCFAAIAGNKFFKAPQEMAAVYPARSPVLVKTAELSKSLEIGNVECVLMSLDVTHTTGAEG